MPEAPIDKHGDFRSHEGDVRPAARAGQRDVDLVTQAKRAQGSTQGHLARRIAAPSGLHSPSNFR